MNTAPRLRMQQDRGPARRSAVHYVDFGAAMGSVRRLPVSKGWRCDRCGAMHQFGQLCDECGAALMQFTCRSCGEQMPKSTAVPKICPTCGVMFEVAPKKR